MSEFGSWYDQGISKADSKASQKRKAERQVLGGAATATAGAVAFPTGYVAADRFKRQEKFARDDARWDKSRAKRNEAAAKKYTQRYWDAAKNSFDAGEVRAQPDVKNKAHKVNVTGGVHRAERSTHQLEMKNAVRSANRLKDQAASDRKWAKKNLATAAARSRNFKQAVGLAGLGVAGMAAGSVGVSRGSKKLEDLKKANYTMALKPLSGVSRNPKVVSAQALERNKARALQASKKYFAGKGVLQKSYSASRMAQLVRLSNKGGIKPGPEYARAMVRRKQYGMVGDKGEGQVARIHSDYFGNRAQRKGKYTVLGRKKPRPALP